MPSKQDTADRTHSASGDAVCVGAVLREYMHVFLSIYTYDALNIFEQTGCLKQQAYDAA